MGIEDNKFEVKAGGAFGFGGTLGFSIGFAD